MLQAAYHSACMELGRCPVTSVHKDDMARAIIQIYECGILNPNRIAQIMVKAESVKPRPLMQEPFAATHAVPAKHA